MVEPLDPNKYHILTPKTKILLTILFLIVFLVALPISLYFYYNFAVNRPAQGGKELTFEIKKGDSLDEIANSLYENGLVNSRFLFYAYTRLNNYDKNIQAGIYRINAGTSVVDLAKLFQNGTNDTKVTFLEGWRVEEFAREAAKNLKSVDYDTLVKLAKPHEGYLFPDTYYFNVDVSEQYVLDFLLKTFKEKTKSVLTTTALEKAGLTLEQAVIFASIVEREVHRPEDQKKVAGILIKRWKENQLIGADATTQYVVAKKKMGCKNESEPCPTEENALKVSWWPQELFQEDLDLEDPYNTRKVLGLPPAPISNPGLKTLEAVLQFETTPYYYYLTDLDGVAYYAVTYEEHLQNIRKYLK